MPSKTTLSRVSVEKPCTFLPVLFKDSEIYVWGLTFQLGKVCRNLSELKQAGLLCGNIESLAKLGYQNNFGIAPDENLLSLASGPFASLLSQNHNPKALIVHHSYGENTSMSPGSWQADFMSRVQYFPAVLLRQFGLDHIPYLGSFSSGCAGFLSLLLSAGCLCRGGIKEPIICLTADTLPSRATYDAQREKILTSDCSSGFFVGRTKCGYKLLGIGYYSTARSVVTLVEIVKRSVQMIRELAMQLDVDLNNENTVLHYPNIFPSVWDMVTQYLKIPQHQQVLDGLPERAHCLSTDSVISLAKYHLGNEGRLHIVVNFGSGLHLGACILREEVQNDSCV